MNIQELEDKHYHCDFGDCEFHPKDHTQLSVKFAIEILENLEYTDEIMFEIYELKKYLDENKL